MKWRDWFVFTARERTGVTVLVVLIVFVYTFPYWKERLPWFREKLPDNRQLASLVEQMQAKRLPADDTVAERDAAYVQSYPRKHSYPEWHGDGRKASSFSERSNEGHVPKKSVIPEININLADAGEWARLPGIGPVLSQRIVAFREKLGGFISKEQVGETYGLQDSVFRKILPYLRESAGDVRKLAVNSASEKQLAAHPLIRWKLAKQLVAFREQHGGFRGKEDLEKLLSLEAVEVKWLVGYLDFSEKQSLP